MTNPIRIYVGSDQRQEPAERTLEYSIRKHSSQPVEVTFMRAGEGAFKDWNTGQDGKPGWKRGRWPTNFSNFRLAVAELAGWEGHAIYLDSDMLVLGDVAELFQYREGAYTTTNRKRSEVAVIDCAGMKGHVPSLKALMLSEKSLGQYRNALHQAGILTTGIPPEWNVLDQVTPNMHFTDMRTQPWKPWPERFEYPDHPCPKAVDLWNRYEKESR